MELKTLLRILYKYRFIIILSLSGFGLLGFLVSLRIPPTYEASMVVYVHRRVESPSREYFTFEGFYSQQAAKEYTDTIIGFFKSRDLMKQALTSLGKSPEISEISGFSGAIRVRKLSPHLVSVSIIRANAQEAEATISALVKAVSDKIVALNKEGGDEALSLGTIDGEPLVEEIKPRPLLTTGVAAFAGLILVVSFIAFREYLKEESAHGLPPLH